MTLQQIQYFAAVCRTLSFSKAAEELHISQPGISKAMKSLEEECGTALFQRNYNSISLTPEGEILLQNAQIFLEQYADFLTVAHSLADFGSTVRIGIIPMCGNTVFPRLHAGFSNIWPDIRISTVEDTNHVLYDMLNRNEIDLALCVTNQLPDQNYGCYVLKKSRLMLFVSRSHPLAGRETISLKDLSDTPLVLFSDHFGQTQYIHRLFAKNGIVPRIMHQTSQVFTILEYIRSGSTAGFLSEEFAQEEPELCPIAVEEISAGYINLVWKKNAALHPAMQKFIRYTQKVYPFPQPPRV
ncbi:MAG: LysR family transcriptional regulator [Lachnospiraceae bacterium]